MVEDKFQAVKERIEKGKTIYGLVEVELLTAGLDLSRSVATLR